MYVSVNMYRCDYYYMYCVGLLLTANCHPRGVNAPHSHSAMALLMPSHISLIMRVIYNLTSLRGLDTDEGYLAH